MKRAEIMKKLQAIGDKIPKEWMQKAISETMTEDMTSLAERMAGNIELPESERQKFRDGLAKGIFKPHLEKRVDPFWSQKIETFIKNRVDELIKNKQIPPPTRDAWMRKILDKYKK